MLDAFHYALDAGLAEVVAVRLHGQTIDTDYHRLFLLAVVGVVIVIIIAASHVQHTVGNEVLSGAVCGNDRLDQILRHISIVRQELFRILGQAIAP